MEDCAHDIPNLRSRALCPLDAVQAFFNGHRFQLIKSVIPQRGRIHRPNAEVLEQSQRQDRAAIVLLEVMALGCLHAPYAGNFPNEFQALFATLADRIFEDWPDPAGLGPDISQDMTTAIRTTAKAALQNAAKPASNAKYWLLFIPMLSLMSPRHL